MCQRVKFNKMFSKSLQILYFLTVLIPIGVRGADVCLSDLTEQPTYNHNSPIRITVSKATVSNKLPTGLSNDIHGFMTLKNEGNILEAYVDEEDDSFIFGGVLCSGRYILHKVRFYINPDASGRSGHTINGTSYPLELTLIYYDSEKYKTFDEAIGKIAGIVQVATPVKVNSVDNPYFSFIQLISSGEVKDPGSSIGLPNFLIFSLFDILRVNPSSIAYIGSYYNVAEKEQSPGAIYIVGADQPNFIGKDQFTVLINNVSGFDGKSLKAIAPIAEQDGRQLYKGATFVSTEANR